ncbi:MAG: VTT domain-containing protein, partial [Quisquiliibacterium sp.]
LLLFVLFALFLAFFALGLNKYLTLEQVKLRQEQIEGFFAREPALAMAGYFAAYVAITSLSLPGAALMTLLGGALFGLLWGTVVVSIASTLGATLAFVASRFLFSEFIKERHGHRLVRISRGFERDGGLYLLTLRLLPVMPFFVVNLLMGLTPIRLRTFFWVSQIGMLPGTLIYVNVGLQLSQLRSLGDVVSPTMVGGVVSLAFFPLWARRFLVSLRSPRGY